MVDARLLSGIEVLVAVIETGSLARAAEVLGMSDSGVSRAVARLEKRLGTRLIARTTRSLRLTDDGARFHAAVAPLLAQVSEAAAGIMGGAGIIRGRLRAEVDPLFSRFVLAPHLDDFLARYPELSLNVITTEAPTDLVAHGFDCAIRFGEPAASGLIARKLIDTRILTVAAPSYLARHGRPATPADLAAHRCIHYRDPQSGRPFAWEFRRGADILPVHVKGALTVSEVGTLLAACAAGGRHRPGDGAWFAAAARQRCARGAISRLARRGVPPLRLLSIAPPAVAEGPCIDRFLCGPGPRHGSVEKRAKLWRDGPATEHRQLTGAGSGSWRGALRRQTPATCRKSL